MLPATPTPFLRVIFRSMLPAAIFLASLAITRSVVAADEPPSAALVRETVDAIGGEAKLLRLFRITEKLALGADPMKTGSPRTSVLQPPDHWWIGKRDRVSQEKEPAIYLAWAWTLGALVDGKSKLATLPAKEIDGRATYGIRISESITPPMDCYFDRETKRLATIEWRADRHVFADWREVDGCAYPAKCVGYKLKDDKRWYHTEIVKIERLGEVPAENKSP